MDLPDSQDFLCPITLQEYTPENYPVTLPCGHTLSLEASQKSLNPRNTCPICRASLPERYNPQKNYLLVKLLESLKGNFPIKCSTHKEENAIAICTHDKTYLCVKCLRNDKCPEENIIPKEKFKAYLLQEATKMDEKENEILEGLFSDVKISEDVSSSINPLLIEVAKWELSKQYHAKNLKEKQELTQKIFNSGHPQANEDGQIKVLKDIEAHYKNLEGLKTQEQIEERAVKANKIAKKKLISFLCEEPIKVSVDNSLKEMKENVDKDFCEKLEVYFKGGFNNRSEFFEKLKELENLESISLQNLAAFENFGAQDLEKLTPICQKLTSLNMDFASVQKNQNEASGLGKFFTSLQENKSLKTLQLSFKESSFVSEYDLFYLHELLLNSQNISSVTLSFEKCESAANGEILFLLENANSLKEFNVNLLHCSHLAQDTLKRLTKYFWLSDPAMNHFKALSLKLGHSHHISDSWLQSFSFYLRQMHISRLTLHFQACPEIEYQGVNHLVSAISQIQSLKELDLSFVDCKKLYGVRVFKNLSKCMKKLKNLKVFMLCIKECPNFHFDGLEKFRNEIKNVPIIELDCPVMESKKEIFEFNDDL